MKELFQLKKDYVNMWQIKTRAGKRRNRADRKRKAPKRRKRSQRKAVTTGGFFNSELCVQFYEGDGLDEFRKYNTLKTQFKDPNFPHNYKSLVRYAPEITGFSQKK